MQSPILLNNLTSLLTTSGASVKRLALVIFLFLASLSTAQAMESARNLLGSNDQAEGEAQVGSQTLVIMETSLGRIELALENEKAPHSVANFLRYVDEGFYDNTIFHRVIDGFMIQGGGFTADMMRKPTHQPIRNEADNGLQNLVGSIAMARTGAPHSATSQFFINVADNTRLDFRGKSPAGWGYAVFGNVVDGMDVVNEIKSVQTTVKSGMQNVPVETVLIKRVYRKP